MSFLLHALFEMLYFHKSYRSVFHSRDAQSDVHQKFPFYRLEVLENDTCFLFFSVCEALVSFASLCPAFWLRMLKSKHSVLFPSCPRQGWLCAACRLIALLPASSLLVSVSLGVHTCKIICDSRKLWSRVKDVLSIFMASKDMSCARVCIFIYVCACMLCEDD